MKEFTLKMAKALTRSPRSSRGDGALTSEQIERLIQQLVCDLPDGERLLKRAKKYKLRKISERAELRAIRAARRIRKAKK